MLGTESRSDSEILIFPNPAEEILNIYSEKSPISLVEIFDLQGKKVSEKSFSQAPSYQIDIFKLSAGIYLLKINSENTVTYRKIIKK